MPKRRTGARGEQKGAQGHAEGEHGEKTRARLREMRQSSEPREPRDAAAPDHARDGRHRLFERRAQHDEADRNSEKNRLSRDIDAHGHVRENFQVVGGAEAGRAMPRSRIDPEHPDAPNPNDGLSADETPQRLD